MFIRVSIPKSTLKNAYRFQPKTRKEFEATDSMALSHVRETHQLNLVIYDSQFTIM